MAQLGLACLLIYGGLRLAARLQFFLSSKWDTRVSRLPKFMLFDLARLQYGCVCRSIISHQIVSGGRLWSCFTQYVLCKRRTSYGCTSHCMCPSYILFLYHFGGVQYPGARLLPSNEAEFHDCRSLRPEPFHQYHHLSNSLPPIKSIPWTFPRKDFQVLACQAVSTFSKSPFDERAA